MPRKAPPKKAPLGVSLDLPDGAEGDSPLDALLGRQYGGVSCYADGIPGQGKTTLLQWLARQRLKTGNERIFWWGEARPQWSTFFPNHYQLLVQKGLKLELVRQWPGEAREDPLDYVAETGLEDPAAFYAKSRADLVNVLVYDPADRANRLLEFMEFLNRRPGLEYVSVIVDETAKIAPGAAKREDGTYWQGLRFARILEDTRKSYVSVYMSSHFPTDLWYVCTHKIQFRAAFAGQHNPKDRHAKAAHNALVVGDFGRDGQAPAGKRYDKATLLPPPAEDGRLLLRVSSEGLNGMQGGTGAASNPPVPKTITRLAEMFGTTPKGLAQAARDGKVPRSWINHAEAAEDPDT